MSEKSISINLKMHHQMRIIFFLLPRRDSSAGGWLNGNESGGLEKQD